MKFFFTVKLPSRGGGFVQSIVGDYPPANSISELAAILNETDFIVVTEEFESGGSVRRSGTILHGRFIGKVRAFREGREREHE